VLPVVDDPRFAPAPERALRSIWSMLPADLAAAGAPGDPVELFSRIQRLPTWADARGGEGPTLGGAAIGHTLGKKARAFLEGFDTSLPALTEQHASSDGAARLVLTTTDGHAIEAVHMPRAVKNPRVTLCVSSQVGCAMGCTFCATGTMGIVRNLSAGEIVGEVITLQRALGPKTGHALNLVFMGMGEPLHNLDHIARAVEVLCHERGVGMSPNRITVSTSGLVPGIDRLAALAVRPLLALSVNATTDEARSRIMPVNNSYNLARLKEALARFPLRRGEKILLEYVLLAGKNDTDEDAVRLAEFARGIRHNVNVIPLNEHAGTTDRAPHSEHVMRFARRLSELGCLCTVRQNRGRDVRGACGQLVQPTLIETARQRQARAQTRASTPR
jgi:23S rRNA (adenine2503-C2)-methyltransferase